MIKISEFASEVLSRDLERPNLFAVSFGVPPVAGGAGGADETNNRLGDAFNEVGNGKLLTLFCDSANIPGITIATDSVRRYGLGPSVKMPMAPTYSDVSLSFIADAGGVTYNLFYEWINEIHPFATPDAPSAEGPDATARKFVMSYKKNYQTDLEIATYRGAPGKFKGGLLSTAISVVSTAAGAPFVGALGNSLASRFGPQLELEKIRTVKLFKAYPTAITDMNVSHSSGDSYSRFTVNFTYYSWNMEKEEVAKANAGGGLLSSLGL